MKIFIGSASNMKKFAEQISFILLDNDCTSVNWWEYAVFKKNQTINQNLLNVFSTCDAALFIFSEDDELSTPNGDSVKIPRDNVLFEYGLFTGMHGADKCVILRMGNPKLPVDISGVLYIQLDYEKDYASHSFKQNNTERVKIWLEDLKAESNKKLNEKIIKSLKDISLKLDAGLNFKIEEVILSLEGKASDIDYNEINVMKATQAFLQNGVGKSIFGIDVVGPNGWLNPSIYHYLAPQVREYLRKNLNGFGQFHLKVDKRIASAITNAVHNAKSFLKESYTEFDNISENFKLEEVESTELNLQYCRVLLWSRNELMRPETLAVIRFHEAFRIPLFFLDTKYVDKNRDDDFLIIEDNKNTCLCCCNSTRKKNYRDAEVIVNFRMVETLSNRVKEILEHKEILFAEDARLLIARQQSNVI